MNARLFSAKQRPDSDDELLKQGFFFTLFHLFVYLHQGAAKGRAALLTRLSLCILQARQRVLMKKGACPPNRAGIKSFDSTILTY